MLCPSKGTRKSHLRSVWSKKYACVPTRFMYREPSWRVMYVRVATKFMIKN